jgi:hypothetical protein
MDRTVSFGVRKQYVQAKQSSLLKHCIHIPCSAEVHFCPLIPKFIVLQYHFNTFTAWANYVNLLVLEFLC